MGTDLTTLINSRLMITVGFGFARVFFRQHRRFTIRLPLVANNRRSHIMVPGQRLAHNIITRHRLSPTLNNNNFLSDNRNTRHIANGPKGLLPVRSTMSTLSRIGISRQVINIIMLISRPLTLAVNLLRRRINRFQQRRFISRQTIVNQFRHQTTRSRIRLREQRTIIRVSGNFHHTLPTTSSHGTRQLVIRTQLLNRLHRMLQIIRRPTIVLRHLRYFKGAQHTSNTSRRQPNNTRVLLTLNVAQGRARHFSLLIIRRQLSNRRFFTMAALHFGLTNSPTRMIIMLRTTQVGDTRISRIRRTPIILRMVSRQVQTNQITRNRRILRRKGLRLTLHRRNITIPTMINLLIRGRRVRLALGQPTLLRHSNRHRIQ